MKRILIALPLLASLTVYAQVDTSFIYNASRPYGTLDIRIAKSSARYYYLQEDVTFSFRESASGVRTNSFRDMTSWDSSPYTEGNLREKNGNADTFVMNYRLLFPNNYQSGYSEGYPMIVMMHGAGERGNCWDNSCHWDTRSWRPSTNNPPAPTDDDLELLNNDHNLSHGGRQHLEARNLAGTRLPNDPSMPQRAFPGFVLFPQNLNGWDTPSINDAIRLVRLVAKKYNVDPNRIYVHGLSNGGIATYNLIKRAPWLFAAALPMSSPTEAAIINQGMLPEVAHIPIWTFQGGQDVAPSPTRTEGYVRVFREAGADVRYSRYDHLGHGTWNTAYGDPEFFSWMRVKSKRNIHVFYGTTEICASSGAGVRLGLSGGFLAYEWQRNGSTMSGATSHELTATEPGVYRARFSRISRAPSAAQWEEWSPPVTITTSGVAKADISALTTTHLRGPDNATPNTVRLKSVSTADSYRWYKNDVRIDIPGNNMDDTVSVLTITGTSTANNGAYTLRTAGFSGCLSEPSDPVNVFLNDSAPVLPDSNIPGSFRSISVTGSAITLAWEDRSSVEVAYEIWRRTSGEDFEFAGRTPPNAVSFTDRGLLPSTSYEYKIRTLNNSGRSRYAPSDNVNTNLVVSTAADTQPPSTPQNVQVVRNTTNSISLSWAPSTDNNGAIDHYIVYYGSQSQPTSSSEPSHILTGLPSNTDYAITIKAVDKAGLLSAASNQISATTNVTGLWYGHSTGAWTSLDQIETWDQPEFTGWVPNFTLAPRTQDEYFNFEFEGYLYIEQGGRYDFYLNSDDGSRLYIDGNMVVDFDGVHGRSSDNAGFGIKSPMAVNLIAGAHPIRVTYLEYIGGQSLTVAYQGADTGNEILEIPDAALTSGEVTPPADGCAGSGRITRDVWTGLSGVQISSIPLAETPNESHTLMSFEAPQNTGDNYGARIRGYICPPATGNYIFWISGNDKTELWISTDDNPSNKRRIAHTDGYTNVRQWNKYTTQQSVPVALTANQRYYVEALHKEGVGTDHVAVGWQLPNGALERPMPGIRLIPFEESPDEEESCEGNGTVLHETWTGVRNADVASIPTTTIPDAVGVLTIFETPSNVGDNYGTRVSGYICAPQTGTYTFWIASNDHSELWLSTDADPSNKRRIAYVTGATNPRQWTKFSSQQSVPVSLVVGHRYYIEALHKEGVGSDHLAVGWQLPDGIQERPIPGSRLAPFESPSAAMAMLKDEGDYAPQIFPNPAGTDADALMIRTAHGWNMEGLYAVDIHRVTGEMVYSNQVSCENGCEEYSVPVAGVLTPGVYIVTISSNGKRAAMRLLVR